MITRANSGIPNLDELIGGGLLEKSTNLVFGPPGSGKSTLSTQFLLQGINQGEGGLYISLEEDRENFFENMKSFGFNLSKLKNDGIFNYEFYHSEELRKHLVDGLQIIDKELTRINAKRIVIDSVSAYLLVSPHELDRRNLIRNLFQNIQRWKVTALLTAEEGHLEKDSLGYLADSIIELKNDRKIERRLRNRTIEIIKMRGSQHSRQLHELNINIKGLEVLRDREYSGHMLNARGVSYV
jgi:circadian clock protein KaiC